ncbi:helix-turn-helix domain-containing protein [Haloarchaeobius sp. HME9146]|uniref:helix-turn-helix domain-containing protein n=1 Tax=Haloarchaeobius sp. HME9146 TaxID=2978732 RepID=UPI0021C1DC51|nr:helix-turn-helix domain-containing protein [Haloarchaeobius sp. HME9146]MCT9095577.1 helix-turn-helix domain-containing protein [Haloarchaeobius sp. HME9146]
MLTAKVCVRYEGDWTAELARYNVFGEFLASTFRNRRYIGIMALETDDFEETVAVIKEYWDAADEVEVLERYERRDTDRESATLFLRGQLTEFTPLQTLLYEGFLPIGPTKLEDGRECFDLLLNDRKELSQATELLSEFGPVSVERISQDFSREVTPSAAEWQELLGSIPSRQRELLTLALERGYFDIPREVTLEELAEEMGITKTTASNHLRKAERSFMEFLVSYVSLAAEDD